jgi:hypothetical protein
VAEEQDVSVPGVAPDDEPPPVEDDELEKAFGESLAEALDVDTWELGQNLLELYARMEREVEEAVQQEGELRERIREVVFPRLSRRPGAPKDAGVRQAHAEDVAKVHRGLLFNGAVESCDGTCVVNDRLPLTIVQIGVCLVSSAVTRARGCTACSDATLESAALTRSMRRSSCWSAAGSAAAMTCRADGTRSRSWQGAAS